jgi:hypothetical protein
MSESVITLQLQNNDFSVLLYIFSIEKKKPFPSIPNFLLLIFLISITTYLWFFVIIFCHLYLFMYFGGAQIVPDLANGNPF